MGQPASAMQVTPLLTRCCLGLFLASFATPARAAEPYFVDLSSVANTTLENDGQEGWSNEGINDMFLYPPIPAGPVTRNGYHFLLLDPRQNQGKTVLMLKGKGMPQKPQEATATVAGHKGHFLYFLQNSVRAVPGQPQNYVVAVYSVNYADGSRAEIPMHDGIEIHRWWTGQWHENSGAKAWPIFMGANAVSVKWNQLAGVWATQWANPAPEKPIQSITFRSEGLATPAIFAVTLSDEDYYRSEHVKDDYKRPGDVPVDYFAPKLASQQAQLFAEMRKLNMVQGMRSVEMIRPDLLAVTLDAAVAGGAGLMDAKAAAFQQPGAFSITSRDDAGYHTAQAPTKVGRESYEYWNGDVGPFQQNFFYWHTYYLALPRPMLSGKTYSIAVRGLPEALTSEISFAYDAQQTPTPVIKVNQVAYSSLAEHRYAYLGWWAGDQGAVDFSGFRQFTVIDEKTRQPALQGEPTMRQASDALSGEQVWQMDLSALKPGQYHILVPGLGRSASFGVGGDGLRQLYYHTNRAFFHQRCGQELREPYTTFLKPACHLAVYESGHLVGAPNYTPRPGEAKRSFRGGYHDAADFDVFTYHLRSTAQVLSAYEFAPEHFKDGDLNIPESGNGIVDVLDEADWALLSYRDTQQVDGGVPLGRGNDQDAIRDWEREHQGQRPAFGLFPPTSTSCTEYAAVAAQYARIIRPYDARRADGYIESARRAFAWAQEHPETSSVEGGRDLFLAWAAAELYSATGDEAFNAEFKRLYRAGAMKDLHWKLFQFAPTCQWAYIVCKQPGADVGIQKELRDGILLKAEEVARQTQAPAYRVGRGPAEKGNGWGNLNGGGYYADPCLRAYMLTKDRKYLTAAALNADFQLGANPLSRTFITHMGVRYALHPEISEFLYTGPHRTGETVAGITVYGLASDDLKWYPAIPSWRRHRDLGNGHAEICSEFTITETIGPSAMLYSILYALEP